MSKFKVEYRTKCKKSGVAMKGYVNVRAQNKEEAEQEAHQQAVEDGGYFNESVEFKVTQITKIR